jgi:NADH-dependent peroxiredoxin subunit C
MNEQSLEVPVVGKKLPELEFDIFLNDKIEKKKLADYRGKWLVLFFYPADFTFVCPTELRELAAFYPKLQEIGAELVSVSCDTAFVHKAWHDNSAAIKEVKYPMAADPNGALARSLGVYLPAEGLSLRGTFIVDPEGVIKSVEVNDNSIGRSAVELVRKLEAAQYVAAHGGEVCPASWKPGEPTLRPGANLVGKI